MELSKEVQEVFEIEAENVKCIKGGFVREKVN